MRSRFKLQSGFLQPTVTVLVIAAWASLAHSQIVPEYEGHTPLSQWLTPGAAAGMAQMAGRSSSTWFQPMRVILEDQGDVTIYHGRPATPYTQVSPAQFGTLVGHLYRLKIDNMPDLPGVELYPTIEVLDRLHPPPGQKHNFPVLIHIDRKDIDQALAGNLVTRVVYLEQPQLAAPFELDDATRTRALDKMDNALAQADRFGRPMVIVRLGGRVPSAHGEPQTFWGSGGPVAHSTPLAVTTPAGEDKPQAVIGVEPQANSRIPLPAHHPEAAHTLAESGSNRPAESLPAGDRQEIRQSVREASLDSGRKAGQP